MTYVVIKGHGSVDHSLTISRPHWTLRIGTRNDLHGDPYGAFFIWHPDYDPAHVAGRFVPKLAERRGWQIGFYILLFEDWFKRG